ncbi:hypothetical protein AAHZ94_25665 [Streptomyces sp. HSW2009]|uniref:hypothetical protein n=1 Tax=Streptomyces sp. HSW2009 TaxID=3142890 RepID=UPI0032F02E3B
MVTVPARQGFEAADLLLRESDSAGPVLHDDADNTLSFVVPPGTAAEWDVPGSACTRTHGRGLDLGAARAAGAPDAGTGRAASAYPAGEAGAARGDGPAREDGADRDAGAEWQQAAPPPPPLPGAAWLVPPTDAYRETTDPAVLRAALGEAARVIEAMDRCR